MSSVTGLGRRGAQLVLGRGELAYSGSRFAAAGAAVVLAAAVTRVASPTELGRFAVAFAIASLVGIYFVASIRRLVMHRPIDSDLSDLKVTALLGGSLGMVASAVVCGLLIDGRTAAMALFLAGFRAADGYAEIGQGVWCQRAAFDDAARALALRIAASTLVAVAVLVAVEDVVVALAAGFVVRAASAFLETHLARAQPFLNPGLRPVAHSFALGSWISAVSLAILLVEAAPTLGVAKLAGLDDAALLAPLGRIRYAVILIATTLGELYYPQLVQAAERGESILRVAARPLAQFLVVTVVALPVLVLGGPIVFGSKLDDEYGLILLAVLAGAAMGLGNLVSIGLTAQSRILPQLIVFGAAAVVATGGAWYSDWTLEGVFVSQSLACVLALSVFLLLASRAPVLGSGNSGATIAVRPGEHEEVLP